MDLGTERSAISGTSRRRCCSSDVQTRTIHTPILAESMAESNSASAEDSRHRRRLLVRSKLSCVLAAESHTSQDEAVSSKMLCSTKLLTPSASKIRAGQTRLHLHGCTLLRWHA